MTGAAVIVHKTTITKIYDNQPTNSHLYPRRNIISFGSKDREAIYRSQPKDREAIYRSQSKNGSAIC